MFWESQNKNVEVISEGVAVVKNATSSWFISLTKLSEAVEDCPDEQIIRMNIYNAVNSDRIARAKITIVNHRKIKEVIW